MVKNSGRWQNFSFHINRTIFDVFWNTANKRFNPKNFKLSMTAIIKHTAEYMKEHRDSIYLSPEEFESALRVSSNFKTVVFKKSYENINTANELKDYYGKKYKEYLDILKMKSSISLAMRLNIYEYLKHEGVLGYALSDMVGVVK